MNVCGWHGPAMNIHRTPFSGRNFEYYSEDGVFSGYMGASEVAGAKEYGIHCYIKHFALNDSEGFRKNALCTWTNEQAMREIYLKPFEISVKVGGASNAMDDRNFKTPGWVKGIVTADVVIIILLILWEVMTIRAYRKNLKEKEE